MLVLLVVSTAIAFVVPAPEPDAPEQGPAGTTGTSGATGTTGTTEDDEAEPRNASLVEADVKGGSKSEPIRAEPGDRLVLTVDPGHDADIEIPGLGLAGTATEYAPVVFDVRLPAEPGNFPIVEADDRELARIEIAEAD